MTDLTPAFSTRNAQHITDKIKVLIGGLDELPDLLVEAYTGRVWEPLGYKSWATYCEAELDTDRIKIPREDRLGVVAQLRENGLSIRAIAAATGTSVGTVDKDLRCSELNTCEDRGPRLAELLDDVNNVITGTDGKQYQPQAPPRPAPPPPRRRPLTDAYAEDVRKIEQALARLARLHDDDRFSGHRDSLAQRLEGRLTRVSNDAADLAADLRGEVAR